MASHKKRVRATLTAEQKATRREKSLVLTKRVQEVAAAYQDSTCGLAEEHKRYVALSHCLTILNTRPNKPQVFELGALSALLTTSSQAEPKHLEWVSQGPS